MINVKGSQSNIAKAGDFLIFIGKGRLLFFYT